MKPKLSICIPTYNRVTFLKECLQSVLPQSYDKPVEIIISDNASIDGTNKLVINLLTQYSNLKYFKNKENLGYAYNQMRSFELANGEYTAILCDDDLYLDGQVDRILKIISEQKYALIGLNYYGFLKNKNKPYMLKCPTGLASENDRTFNRAYDLLNYPSVGHFSSLIYDSELAKVSLKKINKENDLSYYERLRGIIGPMATDIGLANYMPFNIDYDSLKHICIDYYEFYYNLYKKGLIRDTDIEVNKKYVLSWLPKAILRDAGFLSLGEIVSIEKQLTSWFAGQETYDKICKPILNIVRYSSIRFLLRIIVKIYKTFKIYYRKLRE